MISYCMMTVTSIASMTGMSTKGGLFGTVRIDEIDHDKEETGQFEGKNPEGRAAEFGNL